jgi:hypothetical protein
MPRKSDSLTIKNKSLDRRVKLTEADREAIKELKEKMTQVEVGKMYGVDRRTISFIWFPEKLVENKKRRQERGGSKQYYDREKHNFAMREHREYKKKLFSEGLI